MIFVPWSTNKRFDFPGAPRGYSPSEYAALTSGGHGYLLVYEIVPKWRNLGADLGRSGISDPQLIAAYSPFHTWVVPTFWSQLPFLLMLVWLVITRRRPHKPGHCQKCNYNLTGNTSGRCPECGAAVPDSKASAVAMESPEPKIPG